VSGAAPSAATRAEGRISVVIPVLNEERQLPLRLAELAVLSDVREVVVVDGGSTDGTREVARAHPGVRLVEAPRGRASQMNAGAAVASGEVLLFLHADVALPPDATRWVEEALADGGVVAGAFRTWTVHEEAGRWFSLVLHLADMRSRYSGLPYGDQALFVRAGVFRRIGGFPPQPLMEDLELSRRLRKEGRVRTVPARVRVSGRRFVARPLYYAFLVNVFPFLYKAGVKPQTLARLYGNPR
jgi:rSAM/selenodomain-associated transferase 2